MKCKKILMGISLLISLAMIGTLNVNALSDTNIDIGSNKEWVEDTEDIYSTLVDSLSQTSNYAGVYFKDNVLYISTTDTQVSEKFADEVLASNDLSYKGIYNVKFNDVKYTYDELKRTKDYIDKNMLSLNIVGTYTDPENQSNKHRIINNANLCRKF